MKMADTSDFNTQHSEVSSHDAVFDGCTLSDPGEGDTKEDDNISNYSSNDNNNSNNTSLNTSQLQRLAMDGDGDGAPTSSLTASPRNQNCDVGNGDATSNTTAFGDKSTTIKFNDSSSDSTPQRSRSAGHGSKSPSNTPKHDLSKLDMFASWSETSTGGGSVKAGMLADPAKIAREREKEERVRQARERLMEERRRKLEELREQQRLAQENREKQLALRRQKIEDLRRRDHERRAAVEERRRQKEDAERARRESILAKSEERVARYEAWKAGGRKGMFGGGLSMVASPGSSPRHQLSVSTSVLYHKRSPEFASMGVLSNASKANSRHDLTMDRTKNRSASSRRDKSKDIDGKSPKTTKEGEDMAVKDRKSVRSSSFYDRLSTPKFTAKDSGAPSPKDTPPAKKETPVRLSPRKAYSTSNLAQVKKRTSVGTKVTPSTSATTPRARAPSRDSPRNRPSTATSGSTPKLSVSTPSSAHRHASPKRAPNSKQNISASEPKSSSSSPRVSPPPIKSQTSSKTSSPTHQASTPVVKGDKDETDATSMAATAGGDVEAVAETITSAPSDDGTSTPTFAAPPKLPSSSADITAEEYKARLAEKRRQAREKAEREEEEARQKEKERMRLEEEEDRRQEEEALRIAEEARKAEAERLEKAIEAEEKRKKEEAERLEAERIAREEAERKAKEEAERLFKEQQERSKKEEEERLERKKKLEMIMKRVKPDANACSGSNSVDNSPLKTTASSIITSNTSLNTSNLGRDVEKETSSPEEEEAVTPLQEGRAIEPISDAMMSSFYVQEGDDSPLDVSTTAVSSSTVVKSASSDNILDGRSKNNGDDESSYSQYGGSNSNLVSSNPSTPNRTSDAGDGDSSKPKFKSPLLQHLVENKGGSAGDTPLKFKSPLLQNLLGKTKVGARMGLSASMGDLSKDKEGAQSNQSSPALPTSASAMTTSMTVTSPSSSSDKELARQEQGEVDKDEDTAVVGGSPTTHTNGVNTLGDVNISDSSSEDHGGDLSSSSNFLKGDIATNSTNGVHLGDSALGSSLGFTMGQSSVISNGHHKPHDFSLDDSSISLHSVHESGLPSEEREEKCDNIVQQNQFDDYIDLLDGSGSSSGSGVKAGAPILAFEESMRAEGTESLS